MDPGGSKQNGGVVNMTRAMEALSPFLYNPRMTIVRVEGLVVAAAVLLLLQVILGCCRRLWHNSFLKYGLQVCTKVMDPLIIYTLGTMQSSPVKISHYPIWAGFLILISMGPASVQKYDFHRSFHSKCIHTLVEAFRLVFYTTMISLLLFPNPYVWDWDPRRSTNDFNHASVISYCVYSHVAFVMMYKILLVVADKKNQSKDNNISIHTGLQVFIEIDKILKPDVSDELIQSYALSQLLLSRWYFGQAIHKDSIVKASDFVIKKLQPPQGDSKKKGDSIAAFGTVEAELGFCHDFFFTKYHYNFKMIILLAVYFVYRVVWYSVVGALAIRKSLDLALGTPKPIIEVYMSEADHIITILVLGIALLVELVETLFFLASNWGQVFLAFWDIKNNDKSKAVTALIGKVVTVLIGKPIGFLRWFIASGGALRKNMDQYSVLSGRKDPVNVSGAVKEAIAMSITSYKKQSSEETSLRHTFKDRRSQLEDMLIWHIATEYCNMRGITQDKQRVATKFSIFWASLTGQVNGFTLGSERNVWNNLLQLIGSKSRTSVADQNVNATRDDGHRHPDVAVQLSRYWVYLIGSVPELLPYHKADIDELAEKMTEEDKNVFRSYKEVNELEEAVVQASPWVQEAVKLIKQLKKMADPWKEMQDFWVDAIIQAAAFPNTTKQHMQRLENGGEFLTHIWTLFAHVLDRDEDRRGWGVRIPVKQVVPAQEEIV